MLFLVRKCCWNDLKYETEFVFNYLDTFVYINTLKTVCFLFEKRNFSFHFSSVFSLKKLGAVLGVSSTLKKILICPKILIFPDFRNLKIYICGKIWQISWEARLLAQNSTQKVFDEKQAQIDDFNPEKHTPSPALFGGGQKSNITYV